MYFGALESALSDQPCPSCWHILFDRRDQDAIVRIQFAFAGAKLTQSRPFSGDRLLSDHKYFPQQGDTHYNDYTALNTALDSLIESAKHTLHVRLLGSPLPPVSHVGTRSPARMLVRYERPRGTMQNSCGIFDGRQPTGSNDERSESM
jgi:uncharacterized protein DUF5995